MVGVALRVALLKETDMSQWRKAGPNEAFMPEEIDARLKAELPKWYYEDVIMWQPGAEEGSALAGTPDDPRFKYIKYD